MRQSCNLSQQEKETDAVIPLAIMQQGAIGKHMEKQRSGQSNPYDNYYSDRLSSFLGGAPGGGGGLKPILEAIPAVCSTSRSVHRKRENMLVKPHSCSMSFQH